MAIGVGRIVIGSIRVNMANHHSKMLDEIVNQPGKFSILGVICAFREPIIKVEGQKTIDIHFKTARGDVLVEYKNSIGHKDYAVMQLNEYAEYLGIVPYRKVLIWGHGWCVDV